MSMEFSFPILGQSIMAPHVGVVTHRYVDNKAYPPRPSAFGTSISQPGQPGTRRAPSTGVVQSSCEDSVGPGGRPSHYSSTVYKSPYGKTYRFNSHF